VELLEPGLCVGEPRPTSLGKTPDPRADFAVRHAHDGDVVCVFIYKHSLNHLLSRGFLPYRASQVFVSM
jgi:hypothetical protein